jgi:hypothetical protein
MRAIMAGGTSRADALYPEPDGRKPKAIQPQAE